MKTWIKNGKVLLWQPHGLVEERDILLEDGVIAELLAPGGQHTVDTVIDATGKLVMPGLVNCHTHSYMTLFRNFADDLSFEDWLFGRVMPVEDRLLGEDAHWANLLAAAEMIRTGTTAYADMHMFAGQSLRAAEQSGLRAVICRGLACGQDDAAGGQRRLREAMEEREAARSSGALASFMLGPHAIYTCHEGYLRELVALAEEQQMGFHIHVSETKNEVEACRAQHGQSPVAYLAQLGLFSRPTLAAHCVWLDEADIALLQENQVSVASCPVSNMKLGNGFAPFTKLQKAGVNVALGTDGAASNNTLNMFREMTALSLVHKAVDLEAQSAPAADVLRCATLNGARALGLAGQVGEISPGHRADLVLLDLNRAQFTPQSDPLTGLVYAANGSEVDTVLVEGRVLMEKGELKTLDEERVFFEMEKLRQKYLV